MNVPRRIATERVTADIDGVNTVVAEPGQVVPLAYEHLVPADKASPLENPPRTRSTSDRRANLTTPGAGNGGEPITGDYDSHKLEPLQAEAERRGLTVEGTGAGGNVKKSDVVAALKAHDDENGSS